MSLGEVEKASRESIAHLVLSSEAIISEEHRSWTSAANKQEADVATENGHSESSISKEDTKANLATAV